MSSSPTFFARRRLPIIVGLTAFFLGQSFGWADADFQMRRFNFWGRFRPGSWVVVRHATETLDPTGHVTSTSSTETRTTLAGVENDCVRLQVQASLEVGGKKLDGPTQELRQGPNGERPEMPATYTLLGTEEVRVQERTYVCQVEQSEFTLDGRTTVQRIWTSPVAGPFELRRQTTVVDTESGKLIEERLVEVVGLSRERRILARTRPVAELRIVHRHPRGSTTAQAVNCPDVPGGVVSQTAEEYDIDGNLLRRWKIELVDFETK